MKTYSKYLVKRFLPKGILLKIKDKYHEMKGRKNEQEFRGDAVFCPCCKKKFSKFMDFSSTIHNNSERYLNTYKNTVCPSCFSMPRQRIICYYLNMNIQSVPQNNILIFGAEFSIKKWFDMNGFHYQTADLFDRSADFKVDIQNIPFPDESWKLILCNHILEHVPDFILALKELKRVLSKDGFLVITVPIDRNFATVYEDAGIVSAKDRIKHFGQADHLRIFGNDFDKILNDCGFLVEVVNGDMLPTQIGGVIGPVNYDDNRVYICRRR